MIPKSTHHLEKLISELRVDKAYLEKRLAEADKERDEFSIEFATWAMDHAKWSDYVLHNGMVTLLEKFKQQKK